MFALFSEKRLPKGKAGQLTADGGVSFAFVPNYTDDFHGLFYGGDLSEAALAALRAAKGLSLGVDRRELTSVSLEGTGFAGALDGVIACSKGEQGWWGAGAKAVTTSGINRPSNAAATSKAALTVPRMRPANAAAAVAPSASRTRSHAGTRAALSAPSVNDLLMTLTN